MSINKVFFSTAAALMMLGACSNEYFIQTEGNMPTKDDIMQVKRGMPQSEVRKIMGSPSVISSLDHRTWIYMNSTMERMAFFEPEELDRNVVAIEFNHDGKADERKRAKYRYFQRRNAGYGQRRNLYGKILRRRRIYADSADEREQRAVNLFFIAPEKVLT